MKDGFEERLQEILAGEELDEKMEAFMAKYAHKVVSCSKIEESKGHEGEFEGGEFSHEAHSIYDKYVHMMEGILGDFQESEELSNFEFKKAFEDMEKLNPLMVKLILCTWEFGYFLDICKEFCDLNGISSTAESKDDEGKGDDEKDSK